MMIPKIITHAASVVAQNKKDHIQVLSRRTHSKSNILYQPAFQADPPTMPATCLERHSRIAQSNHTQGYVTQ